LTELQQQQQLVGQPYPQPSVVGSTTGIHPYRRISAFSQLFFPANMRVLQVLEQHADKDAFCKYNDPLLQLFVSVLFLAGIVGAFIGSFTAKKWGRRPTMMLGGLCFLVGAVLMAPAVHVAMLIIGRVVMGLGELNGCATITAGLHADKAHAQRGH
jgi:MFS family permease